MGGAAPPGRLAAQPVGGARPDPNAPIEIFHGTGMERPYTHYSAAQGKTSTGKSRSCWPSSGGTSQLTRDQAIAMEYADRMVLMGNCLTMWKNRQIDDRAAMMECDDLMSQIRNIGVVDATQATLYLAERGIYDTQRVQIEDAYQDLLRAVRPPPQTQGTFQPTPKPAKKGSSWNPFDQSSGRKHGCC
mmetsp:Transcript_10665/g.19357  ORF Transcript_10665/g.19357 Transcript_10665/m.19357 type:complete len:188 (-) Transcript_10665:153-716(-)